MMMEIELIDDGWKFLAMFTTLTTGVGPEADR